MQEKLAAAVQEETRMMRITFSDYLSVCRVTGALLQKKLAAAVQEETRMIRITFSDYLRVGWRALCCWRSWRRPYRRKPA